MNDATVDGFYFKGLRTQIYSFGDALTYFPQAMLSLYAKFLQSVYGTPPQCEGHQTLKVLRIAFKGLTA